MEKTKQQKVIDKTFKIVHDVLTIAENLPEMNVDQKWLIHHILLSLIPTVETIFDANGFSQTDKVIERIKNTAEIVASADRVAAYG